MTNQFIWTFIDADFISLCAHLHKLFMEAFKVWVYFAKVKVAS